jgi:hypothetical protein
MESSQIAAVVIVTTFNSFGMFQRDLLAPSLEWKSRPCRKTGRYIGEGGWDWGCE